jgi:hypothetical protein
VRVIALVRVAAQSDGRSLAEVTELPHDNDNGDGKPGPKPDTQTETATAEPPTNQ